MALLSIANLTFSYGDQPVLDGVNLSIENAEHVGMVGRNGCGKSTLLKLIAGLGPRKPESGQIQLAGNATAGYLEQDPKFDPNHTLRDEAGAAFAGLSELHEKIDQTAHEMAGAEGEALEKLMKRYEQLEEQMHSAGGYAVDHKIDQTLHGLGLTDDYFHVPVTELSGGQRGRLALAKTLLAEPDVLLLDEPTNHLDIAGRQWLEQFLAGYGGAVIVISHDRWLLDRVVRKIYELERGRISEYPGNYQQYRDQRHQRDVELRRKVEKQQEKVRQEQEFIDRYRAGQRAKQAQGREKRLERYKRDELIEPPPELGAMKLSFAPKSRSGDIVSSAKSISVRYDQNTLFQDVVLSIKRGDRIGIIGPNGAGKSTLVRCLIGEQPPTDGEVRKGASIDVGYFRQTHEHLDLDRTVIEHLRPYTDHQTEQEARDLAGAFLFTGIEQDKPLSALSGGERSRTMLAALVAGGHNLLVLDEPTNHLDIPSADRLEEALSKYTAGQTGYSTTGRAGSQGTLLLITHDRMLLDHLVDQLLILDGEGHVQHFLGTYSEYLQAQRGDSADGSKPLAGGKTISASQSNKKAAGENQSAKQHQKTNQPSRTKTKGKAKQARSTKSNKPNTQHGSLTQKQLEKRIEDVERQRSQLDAELSAPGTYQDPDRLQRLQQQRQDLDAQLTPLETEWSARAER